MSSEEIIKAMAALLDGQPTEEVVPALIVASARTLAGDAGGDFDKLSTLLLRFCRLVENEAADMLEGGPPMSDDATEVLMPHGGKARTRQ